MLKLQPRSLLSWLDKSPCHFYRQQFIIQSGVLVGLGVGVMVGVGEGGGVRVGVLVGVAVLVGMGLGVGVEIGGVPVTSNVPLIFHAVPTKICTS